MCILHATAHILFIYVQYNIFIQKLNFIESKDEPCFLQGIAFYIV